LTNYFVSELHNRGLKHSDITHVICSHGHSDHVGNLNLFPVDALLIVGFDISRRDTFLNHGLAKVSTVHFLLSANTMYVAIIDAQLT